MEPKGSKLYRIIFLLLIATLVTQCGVKGPPITDREDQGPLSPYDVPVKKKKKPEKNQ